MSSAKRREEKYAAIALYNSNVITLSDLKSLFRVTATVADKEYSSKADQNAVLGAQARLDRIAKLAMTRDAAKQQAILNLSVKPKLTGTRKEAIAKFTTKYRGALPHNWKRYKPLVTKPKRKNKPRHGSSAGKIARPQYIGWKKFNKDMDNFTRSLKMLLQNKRSSRQINSAINKIRKGVNISVRRGN